MTTRANNVNGDHHNHHPNNQQRRRPPPPPASNPYHRSSSSSASFKGCCCCLFLLLTFLALLVVAVVLVIILAVKPKKPQYDLQQVGVQYLLVTAPQDTAASPALTATSTAAYLSLNITLMFTAENPNKVGLKYGSSAFYVMYKGVPLGLATVPGFEQPAHSTRLVETRVSVNRVNVLQADAIDLVRDAALNDRVELRITGEIPAKISFLGFTSPRVQVSVDCAIVISPRKQSLTYKQCGVDGLNV